MESGILAQKINSECVRDSELLARYSNNVALCLRTGIDVHAKIARISASLTHELAKLNANSR